MRMQTFNEWQNQCNIVHHLFHYFDVKTAFEFRELASSILTKLDFY